MPTTPATPHMLGFLCLASAGWAFGFGLGAPLASLWLQDAGADTTLIGLNTGIYYLGIALTAAVVPRLMRRWGNGCMMAGMVLSGVTVAAFPWSAGLAGWTVLRLANGVGGAMSLIPLETRVNRSSAPEVRARNFGFYAFSVALGWALGNLVGLQMYSTWPRLAFALGGLVSVAAALAVRAGLPPAEEPDEETYHRAPLPFADTFLGFGSAWCQGFLEGGMVALLPIYLLATGMTEAGVSWLTSGIMIGVILFQVPVAWLADRLGRTNVLIACYLTAITGLAFMVLHLADAALPVWLFLVGACSGAFYPLGLAILGERLPAEAMARASAWYLAINCLGSLVGPVITGEVMKGYGKHAMFAAGAAAVCLVLVSWVVVSAVSSGARRSRQSHESAPRPSTTATDAMAEAAVAHTRGELGRVIQ